MIEDEEAREQSPTIGYYAMFEYLNGFRKAMYWSKGKMVAHAKKYSPGYKKDLEKGTQWTFWAKDFDGMAYKTMLRQLISKWGIMSIDLIQAWLSSMRMVPRSMWRRMRITLLQSSQQRVRPQSFRNRKHHHRKHRRHRRKGMWLMISFHRYFSRGRR